jgi:Mrp family chromosome partitioning ATPase
MSFILGQLADERARASEALRMLTTIYGMVSSGNTNQLEIIEPAGAVYPVNQNLLLRMAASALAGILLVMSLVFAYEYFDDTIRVPADFTRSSKAPLLSSIEKHNHSNAPGFQRVITFAEPNSPAANNYRTAVTKLLFSIGKSMPQTLLVSSLDSAGDDTALATANLGVAFAQAGNRVVLVDAQLNKPELTQLLEANGKTGLSDLLSAKSSELKLVSIKEMADIQLLPAGMSADKWSASMMNFSTISKRVEELKKEADLVLFASPPILGFAESLALASQVNGVILVGRYGEAHSKMINEVAENLKAVNVPLTGVIFEHTPSPFVAKRNLKKLSPVAPVEKSNIS